MAERKADLTESEKKFRKICASAQDAIIMLDNEGRISYWNKAAKKMFDYKKKEVFGKYLHELIIPERFREHHLKGFKRFKDTGQGDALGKTLELAALRKDGVEFPIELSLSGVKIKGKWNAIGIVRDITERKKMNEKLYVEISERKKAQEELKRYMAELERSNSELQQFAHIASHDLQEPLRMISSYVQLLKRRYKDKIDTKADRYINHVVDGTHRLQMLINDLLTYSRVGKGSKELELTDCSAVFDKTIVNLRKAIDESGAQVSHGALPTMKADALQLGQLFQNLIGNAIKFRNNKPPEINVSAVNKGDEWLFAIRDNGIGIDPKHFERIFSVFQRLHSKAEYSGTGIGLAICKKVVERHGGRIWVESEPGKGTTFYFTIKISGGR